MSAQAPIVSKRDRSGILTYIPLVVAAAFTAGFGWYVCWLAREAVVIEGINRTRFAHFLAGTPNAMGDTLAGFVGSLTLIWVVASVVQQSMELRAQRSEFSEMVKAQDAQVVALKAQTALFEQERIERDESLKNAQLEHLLAALVNVCDLAGVFTLFEFYKHEDDYSGMINRMRGTKDTSERDAFHLFKIESSDSVDDRIFQYAKGAIAFHVFVLDEERFKRVHEKKNREIVLSVISRLKEIETFSTVAGRTACLRVASVFLPAMRESLEAILELDIWLLGENSK